ncbi:MAG: hypothetical protein JWO31_4095 [Phycisphaerales bacterium]|nr:hypothetical protein [Phycisphaerales bacterium]
MSQTDPTPVRRAPVLPVCVLVRDLILGSRISAVAAGNGAPIVTVRDPGKLSGAAGARLIVDLNLEGAIPAAAAWRAAAPGREVVGFVSHVDADTAKAARAAGVDQVLARSRFVEVLPILLTGQIGNPWDGS